MKLNEKAFANASAAVMAGVYVVCAAFVAFLPGLTRVVGQSWFHGFDFETIWTGAPRGNFLVGLITAALGSWLVARAFAWTYNKLAK